MPRPCTSRAMSTSATLSAMSCVTLLLLHLKSPLALSAERSPQLTSAVTNSHFIRARRPGQLADIFIYWNSESDETFQCLRQSYCFRPDPAIILTSCSPCGPPLSLSCPQRGRGAQASLNPTLLWLLLWITLKDQANCWVVWCAGAGWWFEHWFNCYHSGNNMNPICSSQSSSRSFSSPLPVFCFCW